ncbi:MULTISPECIES: immunity 26/phosphotriesterase HocA family protein [Paenibacillus]|uniref:immunity 26/phosphotriesterase HocA family protein n=1 Tax=Paenibacillus TaxID=44249 RepID=UPI0003D33511|nr:MULTISPECIES: immunity 26/phosphotriesterase HocA family protein [Paenibacillus]AIW42056.1 hypothetical protein X809_40095 [Paenibacillus polymyxa CR1]ALA44306.1 hypothetical protein ABE82_23725 [Paenibacillus peoriae]APQ61600.1 hypothetical protein VK72_24470 [Paenibacillus polymyxa]OMF36211.1 hypothetical protein BK134_00995 [Paenibacillus peoriae]OMF49688.1 hypothetical protein BK135_04475 [Paenibacillus peoriae]
MVFKRIKHREGDIFVIPMHDGRFAVCQVICALYGRFKKAFSFGVLSIGQNQAYKGEKTYLPFTNYRGRFEVIFTATQNMTKGVWPIIDQRPLSEEQQQLKYFNCAGHLYCGDEYIRNLELEEYNQYTVMGVAGYELVQRYLAQYEDH